VSARSEGPGRGAELIVRLPLPETARGASAASPQAAMGESLSRARESGGRRILVVDDHLDGASSLEALLRMLGHEVRQAHDGIEAIEIARAFAPEVIFM